MININLGCGYSNFGDDWVHIDGGDYEHLDYNDITKLEFGDGVVDLIYASHVLEYFDRDDVVLVLKEWYRVLKPGGTIRVAVPDFHSMVKLYMDDKVKLDGILGPLYGKMNMGVDKICHKTTYDEGSLIHVLGNVGFTNIERYDWREYEIHRQNDDHSQAYIPHMDKDNGTLISLNIKAIK